jgi:hypothetical protein
MLALLLYFLVTILIIHYFLCNAGDQIKKGELGGPVDAWERLELRTHICSGSPKRRHLRHVGVDECMIRSVTMCIDWIQLAQDMVSVFHKRWDIFNFTILVTVSFRSIELVNSFH